MFNTWLNVMKELHCNKISTYIHMTYMHYAEKNGLWYEEVKKIVRHSL